MFNRWIEDGLQDVLDQEGIGSIAFKPLEQGLLTSKYLNGIPGDSRAAGNSVFLHSKDITNIKLQKVAKLNVLAMERGQTLPQLALAWVLRGGRVTSALIGASKISQIEDNVGALNNLNFSPEELGRIEQILAVE